MRFSREHQVLRQQGSGALTLMAKIACYDSVKQNVEGRLSGDLLARVQGSLPD
jgi:hypothetical protein